MKRLPSLVCMVLVLSVAACRFERRPEAAAGADTAPPVAVSAGAATEDSVRAVLSAFREALRVGDGSRVASLTVPGAVLIDQEEGIHWTRAARGEAPLPSGLAESSGGLGWERTSSDLSVLGDAALLLDEYTATVSGEDVPWRAFESLVLVRSAEAGWRLRFMHRSRGLGAPSSSVPAGEETP